MIGDSTLATRNPLWATLPAVRANQVFSVGNYWSAGTGPLDAAKVQDDLVRYLLPG